VTVAEFWAFATTIAVVSLCFTLCLANFVANFVANFCTFLILPPLPKKLILGSADCHCCVNDIFEIGRQLYRVTFFKKKFTGDISMVRFSKWFFGLFEINKLVNTNKNTLGIISCFEYFFNLIYAANNNETFG